MSRPHAASIVEDAWHRQVDSVLRRRGWQTRIVAHTGYGSQEFVRVLGRVLLTRRPERGERADAGASTAELRSAEDERRGWRAFITAPTMNVPVTITVGDKTVHTRTDRSGYIDTKVRGHRLAPGWHEARISSVDAEDVVAAVMIVGADETFGLISDIDDTVISTSLPAPDDRRLEHLREERERPPRRARHGDDVPRAARAAPRMPRWSTSPPAPGTPHRP